MNTGTNISKSDWLTIVPVHLVHIRLLGSAEGAFLLSVLKMYGTKSDQWSSIPFSALEDFGVPRRRVLSLCKKFKEMGFLKFHSKSDERFEYLILADRLVELLANLYEVAS